MLDKVQVYRNTAALSERTLVTCSSVMMYFRYIGNIQMPY